MEELTEEVKDLTKQSGRLVHEFLAHSYFVYLASVVIGFAADLIWPIKFSFMFQIPLGVFFILIGTFLSVWAQMASGKGAPIRNVAAADVQHHHFKFGPYTFTRTPTQYGLFGMTLGLSFLYGFFFMALTSVIAFLLGKFVFIKKQEKHLAKKYGSAYLEYKKQVKF
jgi:protein-S-isoprenylcysteine O-methyltransferase Ste14